MLFSAKTAGFHASHPFRPLPLPVSSHLQELTMADLAFVVTTIAIFALVALVAKAVTKL
ncbi:hypothetical protein GCM10018793_16700 [Streptomyces sulfonofaciens]|uniref:Uncharacterized protein n=1 Tax=Streptomyces sulfonofaciens TaxID=68272 RepID=A0A919FZJ1_9ACTN|nr:hypothetical protein [Streptomyces sulfonofaciens]GHH74749.1 hypothetical protein GCM10018793_16700 [Streptomyces sulfonofaciens]